MIRHIVMFGIRDESAQGGLNSKEQADRLGELLMTLPDQIEVIRSMEVGSNYITADQENYDLLLSCDFDTMEDLHAYAIHEEHVKVGAEIGKYKTKRACVDFEI